MERSTLFAAVASVSVAAAIVAGIIVNGSPSRVRMERLDDQRIRDLQQISNMIRGYPLTHGNLPESLEALQQGGFQFLRVRDAESGQPYEYKATGANTYELCADFKTASVVQAQGNSANAFWNHSEGRHCFSLEAGRGSAPVTLPALDRDKRPAETGGNFVPAR